VHCSVKEGVSQTLQQNPAAGINRAARADGADDLESAFDLHGSALYRYALGVTGSREDAEDAVQEVFVRLARAGRIPCAGQALARYLFRAARNAAISALRRRRRDRTVPLEDGLRAEPPGEDSFGGLRDAVRGLPLKQREVLALKVLQQMTFEEIGAALGVSANTAASRYRYAIARLRLQLEDERNG